MKTYHIGIDGNEANVPNRVGSNHYAYGILKGIYEFHPENTKVTVYLKAKPLPDMPKAADWWQYKVIGPKIAWTQWRLPLELKLTLNRPQVFFSPGHYAPRFSPIPTAVTIMDLAFLKMPHLFMRFKRGTKQLADWTEYSVRQAKSIIAISEYTKRDIVEAYGVKPSRIHVAYPGVDLNRFKPVSGTLLNDIRAKYKLPERYILHLGTIQPRKNIVRLVKAFESLPSKYKTWSLVLAGQTGWLTEEVEEAIAKSPQKAKIIRTGFIDDGDIPALLSGAGCLCLVGLYEGFGMPPAEALACGTIPVVAGNTSLPEVVGKQGMIIDPYSIASIAHGIMVVLDLNKEQKIKILEQGRKHIQKFNWIKSARVILKTLYDISL